MLCCVLTTKANYLKLLIAPLKTMKTITSFMAKRKTRDLQNFTGTANEFDRQVKTRVLSFKYII